MLVEIRCGQFKQLGAIPPTVRFNANLNVVLGDNEGSNSIGKSTFMMMLDFVFGGSDYVKKLTNIQSEIGEHEIEFMFLFDGQEHRFARSNVDFKNVYRCDGDYNKINRISIEEFTAWLKSMYKIRDEQISFREAVSPFIRVFKRETLAVESPLQTYDGESDKNMMDRILMLFDEYDAISTRRQVLKELEEEISAYRLSKNYQLTPVAKNKTEAQANEIRIAELETEATRILEDSRFDGLTDIDDILADDVSRTERELAQCLKRRRRIKSIQAAISRDQKQQVKFLTTKDAEMLTRFFPEADMRKLDEIEEFHRKLAKALKDEYRQAESSIQDDLDVIDTKIAELKSKLADLGKPTNVSDAAFGRFADIQIELTNLRGANEAFFKLKKLKDDKKEYQIALNALIAEITLEMKDAINGSMQEINEMVYGREVTAPVFDIKDGKKIELYTPRDAGTGTQYRGVIEFDLAMLEVADVPILVHDSLMFKNIENQAITGLVRSYLRASKQTFISVDKLSSYPEEASDLLSDAAVLLLGPKDEALFGRTWRRSEE